MTYAQACLMVGLLGAGCSAPAVTGVINDHSFVLQSAQATSKDSAERLTLVQSETTDNNITIVSVTLPAVYALGETLPVGVGRGDAAYVYVSAGVATSFARADGTVVRSVGSDLRTASSLDGELVVDEAGGATTGTFHATLTGGGYVEGVFEVEGR
jgi:hypothetical protein